MLFSKIVLGHTEVIIRFEFLFFAPIGLDNKPVKRCSDILGQKVMTIHKHFLRLLSKSHLKAVISSLKTL